MTFQPTCAPNEEAPRETPPDEIEVSLSLSLSLSLRIYRSLSVSTLSLRFYLSLFSISPFHFLSLSFILPLSSAPHTRARAQEHVTIELVLTFSPLSQEEQRIGTSSPPWLSVPKVDFLFKLESKIACQISHAKFPNPFPPSQGRNKEQPDYEAQAGVNVEGMQRITNNIYCNLSIQGADTSSGSANQTVFKMCRFFFLPLQSTLTLLDSLTHATCTGRTINDVVQSARSHRRLQRGPPLQGAFTGSPIRLPTVFC